jgi:hypothetical protein
MRNANLFDVVAEQLIDSKNIKIRSIKSSGDVATYRLTIDLNFDRETRELLWHVAGQKRRSVRKVIREYAKALIKKIALRKPVVA